MDLNEYGSVHKDSGTETLFQFLQRSYGPVQYIEIILICWWSDSLQFEMLIVDIVYSLRCWWLPWSAAWDADCWDGLQPRMLMVGLVCSLRCWWLGGRCAAWDVDSWHGLLSDVKMSDGLQIEMLIVDLVCSWRWWWFSRSEAWDADYWHSLQPDILITVARLPQVCPLLYTGH